MSPLNSEGTIDFLDAELELGRTLVRTAWNAKDDGDIDHYARVKGNAAKAVETIGRFIGKVPEGAVRTEIANQLAELESLISSL